MKKQIEETILTEEFEKICPPCEHKSLLDESEEYEKLREYIMAQPIILSYKQKLPFSEITLDNKNKKITEENTSEIVHLFYIKVCGEHGKNCDATGYYDLRTKAFILKEGSKWATDVSLGYRYTVSEFIRRNLIKKKCKLISGYYIQFSDIICDSPNSAASFVLGRTANGLEEWRDTEGNSIKDIFMIEDV